MKAFAIGLLAISLIPRTAAAQRYTVHELGSASNTLFLNEMISNGVNSRENRCLQAGRVIGALSGSTMGLFAFYVGIKGDDLEGPFLQTLAISIPTTVIGAYVGVKGTEWLTRRILDAKQGVPGSALRGVAYGFVDGAMIGVASMVTLFSLAYFFDAIHFNESMGFIDIIGSATLGGAIFGGMIGAVAGLVYGPGISIYMKF
ncbi:MAG: hypothetical protein KAT18_08460 [Candidatus Latescibacteria bacterium]|nr:hypothetical protein [Candidatus Latescibacterota bacterium]